MKPEIIVATWNYWAYSDTQRPAYLAFAPISEAWRARRVSGYAPAFIPTRSERAPLGELDMSVRLADVPLAPGDLQWSIPTGLSVGGEAPEWIHWTGVEQVTTDFEVHGVTWRDMGPIKSGSCILFAEACPHLDVCAEALIAAGWDASVAVRSEDIFAA